MHVVVLAAAERGRVCLEKIGAMLSANDSLTVFTFPETDWEPPFVADIQAVAETAGADFFVTRQVGDAEFDSVWNAQPDLILVFGWRYLIPASVYESAKQGCFVMHDSYLPEYRGFSPTVWAIRNGETTTGATLFRIADGMDTGEIVERRRVTFDDNEYIADVMGKVTAAYEEILERRFADLANGRAETMPQAESEATYTCKLVPEDFEIDWSMSAEDIVNLVRAYARPYPGAYTWLGGQKVSIFRARVDDSQRYVGTVPGRLLRKLDDDGLAVATGHGQLVISEISLDGGPPTDAGTLPFSVSATFGRP